MRTSTLVLAVSAATLGLGAASASATPVTVTLDGSAKGSVTSEPAGIDCSNVPGSEATDCSFDFPLLATVKLTASPGPDAVLKGWTGTAGGTCAGDTNPCTTSTILFNPLGATATFSVKPDRPVVATGAVSDMVFPSATLTGTVNPNSPDFGLNDCYFEYGTSTAYGTRTPCRPGTVGPGTGAVAVTASAGSLEPGVVYHYRIVAANPGGISVGDDRSLTGAAAPADSCPNAGLRAQQHVLARTLPNCMAYELVSPPFSLGQTVGTTVIAPDGERAILSSSGALEDAGNAPGLGAGFFAERSAEGWRTVPAIPPASVFSSWQAGVVVDYALDARSVLFALQPPADRDTERYTPVRSDADGRIEVAGPMIDDSGGGGVSLTVGTSSDLRTLVIRSRRRTITTDGAPDSRSTAREGLYVSRPDANVPGGFRVRQVAFRAGASMAPSCNAVLGGSDTARGAVSSDGQRIFFSLEGTGSCQGAQGVNLPAIQRVWMREGEAEVEDLSASLCTANCGDAASAHFGGASYDGQRVYFTTVQKLLNADLDDSDRSDLYVNDSAFPTGSRLQNVTASGSAGQGAGVLGVVRVTDDGSHVYFVANGRALAGVNAQGDEPQPGDNNLYVYHRPRSPLGAAATIKFVGRLDPADINRVGQSRSLFFAQARPVATSSDGRHLLFAAYSDLTGEKQPGDAHRDLYRYDAATGELTRIWSTDPVHNGAARTDGIRADAMTQNETSVDGARQKERRRQWMISDDGRTVGFSTAERLSPDDVNDKRDAYMWQAQTGAITMLSDGRSVRDIDVSGVSPGGDVFFGTDAPLVRQHRSGAQGAFVARRGGGFAPPPAPSVPCEPGVDCQPPAPPASAPGGPVGSSTFVGPGNVLMAPPKKASSIRVSKIKTVHGTSTSVTVRVPGKGKLRVSGRGLTRSSRSASKAGSYRVSVKLSKRGRSTLRRKNRVKIRASVRFVPENGKTMAKRVSVTFKTKTKKRRSKASSRSTREVNVQSSDAQKGR